MFEFFFSDHYIILYKFFIYFCGNSGSGWTSLSRRGWIVQLCRDSPGLRWVRRVLVYPSASRDWLSESLSATGMTSWLLAGSCLARQLAALSELVPGKHAPGNEGILKRLKRFRIGTKKPGTFCRFFRWNLVQGVIWPKKSIGGLSFSI